MSVLEDVGRDTSAFLEYAGGVANLIGESAAFIGRLRIRVNETFVQAYLLGVNSLTIVLLTSLFTGMVFSLESAVQAVQYGIGNLVGGVVRVHDRARTRANAHRRGGRRARRRGDRRGVRLDGGHRTNRGAAGPRSVADPHARRSAPRRAHRAPAAAHRFADIISILGGMLVAQIYAHISYDSFLASVRSTLPFEDVVRGLFKALVFAVIIVAIGSYQGLNTRGGAAGVARRRRAPS